MIFTASGGQPAVVTPVPIQPVLETQTVDTPRRRSSRSRTKSPEPVAKIQVLDPALKAVPEESEEAVEEMDTNTSPTKPPTDTQMYEKIIDEMDVDEGAGQDLNEDELLAEEPEETSKVEEVVKAAEDGLPAAIESEANPEEKQGADDENRGTKRRSDSPSKGNTPKKRQRLPPPNIEDFVNDEDEPELDESSLQLSWCKKSFLS